MRLISYHIENYGKIHNADGVFESGLTELCESNGFGKTTLASFLRAMFYGLPSYTTRTKAFDDRQHFYPFEGGKFGGNVTFEMQGKNYKIERFFDKKSAKDDELKVYCDGAPYTGFGEEIGKSVFGLDEEAFKKTVFITADEIEIATTHSINEKLNRDVEGGEDNNFAAAIALLDKAKKELKAGRGANDRISQEKEKILNLSDRIKNLRAMSDSLSEEYVERERLMKEISTGEILLKQATERGLALQKWERLDSLTEETEQKSAALCAYKEKYPNGIPSADERKTMESCLQEEMRLTGSLQTVRFGEEKEKQLVLLQEKFKNGAPRDEVIAEKQRNLTRLEGVKTERDKLQNGEQTAREKELEKRFAGKIPTQEELSQKGQLVEEYKNKEALLKELSHAMLNPAPVQKMRKNRGKIFIFWILAFVCAIVGTVLFASGEFVAAMVLTLGGPLLFVLCGVLVMAKGTTAASVSATADASMQIRTIQAELNVLEEKIRAFTIPYGYYGGAGAVYDFKTLEDDVCAYRAQVVSMDEKSAKVQSLTVEIEGITADLRTFLQSYGEDGEDLQNGLNRLLSMAAQYRSLQEDKAAAGNQANAVQERILQCKSTVAEVMKKYGLWENAGTMDGLKVLELDSKRQADLQKELTALQEKLKDYKEKNNLTERPMETVEDTDQMHEKLSLLRKQLTACDKRIEETEREVEQLPETENELERAEETLKLYKDKHQCISDTVQLLKEAEKNLKDRYIAPIKEKFSFYAEALERVLDEKVTMDSDYRVTFERGGEARSDRHLSAGERSICALCFRLALLDNMYTLEQPFVVMDDPFVHLDETHLKRTAALLTELSKTRQILYFCCHESRSMAQKK